MFDFCNNTNAPVKSHLLSEGLQYYPSDHRKFKFSLAITACRRAPGVGYYIPHLNTPKDRVLNVDHVDYLAEGMERFLTEYERVEIQ